MRSCVNSDSSYTASFSVYIVFTTILYPFGHYQQQPFFIILRVLKAVLYYSIYSGTDYACTVVGLRTTTASYILLSDLLNIVMDAYLCQWDSA